MIPENSVTITLQLKLESTREGRQNQTKKREANTSLFYIDFAQSRWDCGFCREQGNKIGAQQMT